MKINKSFILLLILFFISFISFSEENDDIEDTISYDLTNLKNIEYKEEKEVEEKEKEIIEAEDKNNNQPEITIENVDKKNKAEKINLQILDKDLGKPVNFDVKVGEVIEYKNLTIYTLFCWKSSPSDKIQEQKALLKVFKKDNKKKNDKQIFYGWFFSYYPDISGIEDPDFDITLKSCK